MPTPCCRMPCSLPPSAGRKRHFSKWRKHRSPSSIAQTTAEDVFWPVGNSDWYPHGEDKSLYDQQPVEAATMADAALAAFGQTRDDKILDDSSAAHTTGSTARTACRNRWPIPSGACCDGLQPSGVNRNQGAESTLAFLFAEVHHSEMQLAVDDTLAVRTAAQVSNRLYDTRPVLIGHSD